MFALPCDGCEVWQLKVVIAVVLDASVCYMERNWGEMLSIFVLGLAVWQVFYPCPIRCAVSSLLNHAQAFPVELIACLSFWQTGWPCRT